MNRVILTPATLPASALAELKQWLGITTDRDDALLAALLTTSLDICEGFTGRLPVETRCEERLEIRTGWQALTTRPVQAITALDAVSPQGARTPLGPQSYEIDLAADGTGYVRLADVGQAAHVAVRFTAGLVSSWDALPDSLRHGLMRLAAHQHRERESTGASPLPPAAVAALWQPWRRMRLA